MSDKRTENFFDKVQRSTEGKACEDAEVDLVHDFRPVCPNCHMVIHSRKPK